MTAILECQINTKWQAQIVGFILKLGFSTTPFVASKDNGRSVSEPDAGPRSIASLAAPQPSSPHKQGECPLWVWKQAISPGLAAALEGLVYWNWERAGQAQGLMRDALRISTRWEAVAYVGLSAVWVLQGSRWKKQKIYPFHSFIVGLVFF